MAKAEAQSTARQQWNHLWDEYAMLQGKIDKIGAFKFQIRGWLMTVVVAGLGSVVASGVPAPYALLLLPVGLLMWILEHEQSLRGAQYGARCDEIERLFRSHAPRGTSAVVLPQVARRSRLSRTQSGTWPQIVRYTCRHSSGCLFGTSILLVVCFGLLVPLGKYIVELASESAVQGTTTSSEHGDAMAIFLDEEKVSIVRRHLDDLGPRDISSDDDIFSLELQVAEFLDVLREMLDDSEVALAEAIERIGEGLPSAEEAKGAAEAYEETMGGWSYDGVPDYSEVEEGIDELVEAIEKLLTDVPKDPTEELEFDKQ